MAKSVAVIGNCQAQLFAECIRAADPELNVSCHAFRKYRNPRQQEQLLRSLARIDVVFFQSTANERYRLLGSSAIKARVPDAVAYPALTFYGFHPDFVYLGDSFKGIAANFHSFIVLAAFALGIQAERVPKLFNAYLFARLGYFDQFEAWKRTLVGHASELGYDVSEDFGRWMQQGAFMHIPLHPAVRVVASIAAKAFALTGLGNGSLPGSIRDPFADGASLPVFPELAQRIGIAARPGFRTGKHSSLTKEMDLREYVNQSYQLYGTDAATIPDTDSIRKTMAVLSEELGL